MFFALKIHTLGGSTHNTLLCKKIEICSIWWGGGGVAWEFMILSVSLIS